VSAVAASPLAAPLEVTCAGAPRDLGLAQGTAARAAVRGAVARLPLASRLRAALGADREVARAARDAACHYPHASERLAGLARGAGVGRAALAALLARELAGGGAWPATAGEALASSPGDGPGLLARSLDVAPGARALPWILRTSAPEHDWRSVELALPWLVPAVAGVNERGLAVVGVVRPAAPGSLERCAAPALLLVQECLQRCDGVAKAIEWCERRPSGGSAALLLADPSGEVAELRLDGGSASVERPRDGVLAAAGPGRVHELEKACAARTPLGAEALAEVLAAPPWPGAPARAAVVLDPSAPALALRSPDGRWTRLGVEPPGGR
jgi:hypothetical protein